MFWYKIITIKRRTKKIIQIKIIKQFIRIKTIDFIIPKSKQNRQERKPTTEPLTNKNYFIHSFQSFYKKTGTHNLYMNKKKLIISSAQQF